MARVAFEHVRKDYGGDTVIHDFHLDVADGELVVLVGGSGCGKSTTLRMLAGLETVTAGTLLIGTRDVTHLPPRERDVAMVFQDYALYPHLTARDNIALGLRLRKVPREEIERRIQWAVEMLDLGAHLERKPKQLSGGQRQRVAMGRAMVREPSVFLFDEPLSNLDPQLRGQMRVEIRRLQRDVGVTTLYVTHDQVEAMTLGDRIVVLEGGHIQQVGTPGEVYCDPANRFVAGFIGSPAMNFLEGALRRTGDRLAFVTDGLSLPLEADRSPEHEAQGPVSLGVRPEGLVQVPAATDSTVSGSIVAVERLGATSHWHVEAGTHKLVVTLPGDTRQVVGDVVNLVIDPSKVHLFDAHGRSLLTRSS